MDLGRISGLGASQRIRDLEGHLGLVEDLSHTSTKDAGKELRLHFPSGPPFKRKFFKNQENPTDAFAVDRVDR